MTGAIDWAGLVTKAFSPKTIDEIGSLLNKENKKRISPKPSIRSQKISERKKLNITGKSSWT